MRTRRLAAIAFCLTLGVAATVADATAQWWPWGRDDPGPPIPREPMRRPPGEAPPRGPAPPAEAPPVAGPPAPYGPRGPTNICLQLEQRLVTEVQGTGEGREMLPRIEADIRELERTNRRASIRLDRSDCWDQFLFSKTLRRSQRCIQLNDEVEGTRRRLADLDRQRKQIMGTGGRSALRDDIIRELARNGCGDQYEREARKLDSFSNPFALLFGGEESESSRGPANQFGKLPFATYRTLCVRLCDGYYFPVSFSTLPNHFERDAKVCQTQCAAPADLFYHQNPGGSVEQMVSYGEQRPYTSLATAFRYRKEYVRGCSCKQAEYDPGLLKKAEKSPAAPVPKTADARAGAKK